MGQIKTTTSIYFTSSFAALNELPLKHLFSGTLYMVITETISQMRTEVDKDKITYPKTQSPVMTLTPQWLTTLYPDSLFSL